MRQLTIMLLMTLWAASGCRSANTQIICGQLREHEIPPIKSCDVSFKFNRCRCRCFNFNSWRELPLNECSEFSDVDPSQIKIVKKKGGDKYEAVNYPIDHCEGITGFYLDTAATDVRPNIRALDNLKENLCQ